MFQLTSVACAYVHVCARVRVHVRVRVDVLWSTPVLYHPSGLDVAKAHHLQERRARLLAFRIEISASMVKHILDHVRPPLPPSLLTHCVRL